LCSISSTRLGQVWTEFRDEADELFVEDAGSERRDQWAGCEPVPLPRLSNACSAIGSYRLEEGPSVGELAPSWLQHTDIHHDASPEWDGVVVAFHAGIDREACP
jgi:hypothetical protein